MKSNVIKIICLLLCLALALGAFSGCNPNAGKNASSSGPESSAPADGNSSDEDPGDITDDPGDITDDPTEEPSNIGSLPGEDIPTVDPIDDEEEDKYADYRQLAVYNAKTPATNNYMGMSGDVYHAFSFMKDESTGRVYTDKQMDLELGTSDRFGVRYTRTRFDTKWCFNTATNGWDFGMKRMGYFYDYCKAIKDKLGKDGTVILQLGYNWPAIYEGGAGSITETDYVYGYGTDIYGESNTFANCIAKKYKQEGSEIARTNYRGQQETVTEYYNRMGRSALRLAYGYAQLLKDAKARGINNIGYLIYFTEPSSDWNLPADIPQGYTANEYLYVCKTMKNVLEAEGVAGWVKHMGPNEVSQEAGLTRWVLEREPDLFDAVSTHYYFQASSNSDDVFYDLTAPVMENWQSILIDNNLYGKKELWIDEAIAGTMTADPYDKGWKTMDGWVGLQTALCGIVAQQYGFNNYIIWELHDEIWTDLGPSGGQFNNGIHDTGIIPSLFISSIPGEAYYTLGLFTRYNGYKNGKAYHTNVGDDSGVYVGAVQLEDGSWTVTVVNCEVEDVDCMVRFDKPIHQTLYRHSQSAVNIKATSEARLASVDKVYKDVKSAFVDTVPAASVVVYTGLRY